MGWTSPTSPKLSKEDSDNPLGIAITPDQASWIGSLITLGAAIGIFLINIFQFNIY